MAYIGWLFGINDRPPLKKRMVVMAFLMGAFEVALYALAGLLYGFDDSLRGSPTSLLGHTSRLVWMLVGVEISRAYLFATFRKGNVIVALIVTSTIFWFLSIPVAKLSSITDLPSLLRISCETFLPAGAESLLASLLALIGGPLASIAYRGAIHVFIWLPSISAELNWILTAFLGTITPVFWMLVIRNQFSAQCANEKGSRSKEALTSALWALFGVAVVLLLWFNAGFFGVQPTVVSGVSMEPTVMSGDIVITREVPAESVKVGDIIRFQRSDTFILHRVVEIQKDGGEITFITRGDSNHALDPPVRANQLKGKVILTVPKIGWVTIAARQLIKWTP